MEQSELCNWGVEESNKRFASCNHDWHSSRYWLLCACQHRLPHCAELCRNRHLVGCCSDSRQSFIWSDGLGYSRLCSMLNIWCCEWNCFYQWKVGVCIST